MNILNVVKRGQF